MKSFSFCVGTFLCGMFVLVVGAQYSACQSYFPLDPTVRVGTLQNGLRYYILRNAKPEKRVEMRLAVMAGSCQEDEDQLGLAHFCEHMAFNGTRNFKKNDLVNFLESVGTKFGPHLNAYTSFDETVYMLRVPTDTPGVVDKGLQILAEWAGGIAFEPEEVEKERGVVVEEWRLGQGAEERMRRKYWPVLFGGTRYGDRFPIGKKEILETFPHDVLKRFYYDWYRPELMAVVVVGEVDPADIENDIKKLFSGLKSPSKPRKREEYSVPANDKVKAAVARDPEASFNAVQALYMRPRQPLKTADDFRKKLLGECVSGIVNERLSELSKKPESPFLYAFMGAFDFLRNNSALFMVVVPKTDKDLEALQTVATELRRLQLHGVTASELERQKADMLKEAEKDYNERDKRESDKLAMGLVAHYLTGQPFPDPKLLYDRKKEFIQNITAEDIRTFLPEFLKMLEAPRLVSTGAENASAPLMTEADLVAAFEKGIKSTPEPLAEKKVSHQLLPEKPEKGRILLTRQVPGTDVKEMLLSNGARVYLKRTDFKNDEILCSAVSIGGAFKAPDEDAESAELLSEIMEASGVGDYDASTLEKMLRGKTVSLSFSLNNYWESFSGQSSLKDVETLLQLIHLYFTKPRVDNVGFSVVLERQKNLLSLLANSPEKAFMDSVDFILYGRHPRKAPLTAEKLKNIREEAVRKIMQERLGNVGDFAFVFVGNVDETQFSDWVATYIASIPGARSRETIADRGVRKSQGKLAKIVEKGVEPKSQVSLYMHGPVEYTPEHRWQARAVSNLLSIRLREVLREDKGGVYYVRCNSTLSPWPEPHFTSLINFGCDPQRVDELLSAVRLVLREVREQGASEANVQKIRETLRRELETDMRNNEWWRDRLNDMILYQENFFDTETYLLWVDHLKGSSFKEWAARFFNDANEALFVLKPKS